MEAAREHLIRHKPRVLYIAPGRDRRVGPRAAVRPLPPLGPPGRPLPRRPVADRPGDARVPGQDGPGHDDRPRPRRHAGRLDRSRPEGRGRGVCMDRRHGPGDTRAGRPGRRRDDPVPGRGDGRPAPGRGLPRGKPEVGPASSRRMYLSEGRARRSRGESPVPTARGPQLSFGVGHTCRRELSLPTKFGVGLPTPPCSPTVGLHVSAGRRNRARIGAEQRRPAVISGGRVWRPRPNGI